MASYDLKKAVEKIGDKRLNFALYKGEKERQVVISPKPPTKTLLEAAGCADMTRVTKGLCFWEKNAEGKEILFFAVKGEPQSTWKDLITKAFRSHKCETFLPVEMRSLLAGEPEEVSLDVGPEDTGAHTQTASPAEVPPERPVQESPTAPDGSSGTISAAEFKDRLRTVIAELKDPDLDATEHARLTALIRQAGDFAKSSDLASAAALLVSVEKSLAGPEAPAEAVDDSPAGRLARFGKAWSAARKKFAGELNRIEDAILETYASAEKYNDIARQMPRLHALQKTVNKHLETQLALAKSIPAPEVDAWRKSLREAIAAQLDFIQGDPLMCALDDNPFHKTGIRAQLLIVLQKLQVEVAKA